MEEINVLLVLSISKVDIVIVPLLYLISYLLVGKIEICLKYFLDKNTSKQPKQLIGETLFVHIVHLGEIDLLVYSTKTVPQNCKIPYLHFLMCLLMYI